MEDSFTTSLRDAHTCIESLQKQIDLINRSLDDEVKIAIVDLERRVDTIEEKFIYMQDKGEELIRSLDHLAKEIDGIRGYYD